MTSKQDWRGKRVTVIGFAIEGEDLARYFIRHGAKVTVSTLRVPEAHQAAMRELAAQGVAFYVGANEPAHVAGADLVCVSQSVPLANAAVRAALEAGTKVASMTGLFLDLYPGPVVGITGSSGKTTTTSLVDAVFAAAGRWRVLGGNIGIGLMSLLETARPERWAILEVSHTQLQLTARSPHVAALLNVTPNHLDQFSWEEYVGLKRRIFAFQTAEDAVVFNADDAVCRDLRAEAKGRVFLFSALGDPGADGAFVREGALFWRRDGRVERVLAVREIPLRGEHNVANVVAAAAVAAACEIGPQVVGEAVRTFSPPAHRLEHVARVRGVDFYNDSIATTPERTLAALRSFEEPIVLLLGGREKNLPLDEMLSVAARRCRAVFCFGEAGAKLAKAAAAAGLTAQSFPTLAQAFEAAAARARPGDVVLLSPACTSFDAYENFEQRGVEFRNLVAQLRVGESDG